VEEKDMLELIRQGENDKIEFKTTDTFEDSEEIGAQIVAFTNRNGGKIFFGVKNDGSLEGAIIDVDKEVQRLSHIIRDKCSPKVECSTSFFAFNDGDVLVVNVVSAPHNILQ
jgi:ATP-dependent DNA helicase RecG